jgi:hypothetical protein
MMLGRKPDLSHIVVFGEHGEAFVNSQLRQKDQDMSIPGRVVGYDEISKAFRFVL